MSGRSKPLAALTLSLLAILVLAPIGAGQPAGGADEVEVTIDLTPDPIHPGILNGTSMLACVGADTNNANNWIEYTWVADPLQPTGTSGNKFNFSVRKTMDSDRCVDLVSCEPSAAQPGGQCEVGLDLTNGATNAAWGLLDDCDCMNQTGRWSVYFENPQDGTLIQNNFTVVEPRDLFFRSDVNADANITGSSTVEGFTSFDTKVVEFGLLGLALLAWWNGWVVAGAFAWLGAMGTQLVDPGDLDYTLGFTGFTLVLAIELIGHKFAPMRKIREIVGRQRAPDD